LFGYQFTVEFKPGRLNVATDSLSHHDEEPLSVNVVSLPEFELFDQFQQESAMLSEIITKRAEIEFGTTGKAWRIIDDTVVHDDRIFMLASSKLWLAVLKQGHGMGHEEIQKTLQRLCASFFTPHDTRLVHDHICGCFVCQQHKIEHLHPTSLLQPLLVPTSVWASIAMDFVEGFPKVDCKSVILTIVDCFSKYVHFITLEHLYSMTSVAKAFFD
jgi:hypothetical protein